MTDNTRHGIDQNSVVEDVKVGLCRKCGAVDIRWHKAAGRWVCKNASRERDAERARRKRAGEPTPAFPAFAVKILLTVDEMVRYAVMVRSDGSILNGTEINAIIASLNLAPARVRANGVPVYDPVAIREEHERRSAEITS